MIVRQRLGSQIRRKVDSVDVVHDALMQGVKRQLRSFEFQDENALIRYLSRIAENEIRDKAEYWGRKKRDVRREVRLPNHESVLQRDGSASRTPSQIVTLREDLALLEAAMDLLREDNADYWELIVAIELEGGTYRDVADKVGQTSEAVRKRFERAKIRLAEIYKRLLD